jgi:hypothetical protein
MGSLPGFWTVDRTTITGRSAVILRQHTTPFRPMIVPLDDLELVLLKLEKFEPPHTRKFPRVNAQESRLGPIQTLHSICPGIAPSMIWSLSIKA